MDRITHDIRRSNWLEILNRSQQRPVHTTIKQWCLDNGISEKSYYYWQRKFRQEAPDRFLFHLLQILCLLHLQRFRSHTGINLLDLLQQIL